MKKRYIIAGFSFLLFILVTTLVLINKINLFDESIYNAIFGLRNDIIDLFFKAVTECANPIPIILIYTLLVILLKRNDEIILSVNLLSTLLLNQLLKNIIGRPRPLHLRLIKESGYSYPSGHSMIALCLYGTLIYLTIKRIKRKKLKITLITLLSLLVLLIGLSRIYLGVHYPSDVLGGYLITIPLIIITISLTNNYLRGKKEHDKDGNQ